MSMSNKREKFKKIADETMNAIKILNYKTKSGRSITLSEHDFKGDLYFPDWSVPDWVKNIWLKADLRSCFDDMKISVTQESTLAAAKRLADNDVCVLNFASGTSPGGGFLRGAVAQEETIARSSTLYPTLTANPEFYNNNKKRPGIYDNYAIYSPHVMVIKNDNGEWLDDPYYMSVLTSAAPNMNHFKDIIGHYTEEDQNILIKNTNKLFYKRMIRVLELMSFRGHRTIVLGAWGCGAFGNDPNIVSAMFKVALENRPWFDEVVFAIYDDKESERYQAFERTFVVP